MLLFFNKLKTKFFIWWQTKFSNSLYYQLIFSIFVLVLFQPVLVNGQGLEAINFSRFTSLTQIIDAVRNFLTTLAPVLATLVIVWSGYQYYFAGIEGKEAGLKGLMAGVIGLILSLVAPAVITLVQGTITGDARFNPAAIQGVITSIIDGLIPLSLVASVLVLVFGGYKYFQGGIDDSTDGKKTIAYGITGLVVTLTARAVVDLFRAIQGRPLTEVPGLLFGQSGTIYPLLQAISTALIALSVVASVLVIVWGGYKYFQGGLDGKTDGLETIQKGVVGLVFSLLATFIGTALFAALQQGTSTEFGAIVTGAQALIQTVVENTVRALIFISGIVAVLVIVWGGYQFFFGGLGAKSEGKTNVINGVVGLFFTLTAFAISSIVEQVFTNGGRESLFESGEDLANLSQNALNFFVPALDSIINLLIFIAGAVSVLVVVWGGYQYFFAAEVDLGGGKSKKADGKEAIRNGFLGLVVCIIARPLVEIVDGTIGVEFIQNNPQLNLRPDNIVFLIQSILANLLIPISSVLAIFYLVLGAYYWFTSNGDGEKVKKAKESLLNAIIGFIVVLLAATIVQIIILLVQTTQIDTSRPPVQESDNSNIITTPTNNRTGPRPNSNQTTNPPVVRDTTTPTNTPR